MEKYKRPSATSNDDISSYSEELHSYRIEISRFINKTC